MTGYEVVLSAGQTSFVSFGNFEDGFGTITGVKWNDLDNDGIRDTTPELEPGLSGWTIFVDVDVDGVLDAGEPFADTDVNGEYSITGLLAGTATIREVAQVGWVPSFYYGAEQQTFIYTPRGHE